ncbi:MAG: BREX system P-loop protein BrxC, partial [Deltaproteobacteria bacterium]|nr:BREX system P-loop protein BrxC [Deltaproteobacteria bacterium]
LRNQLSMVHKVIQTNLNEPLGHVVPADFLYFDSADKLLQSRILPRKVHEKTMKWSKGSEEEQLMASACALIFLINKLADSNKEIGIRATVDTLADLLIKDLSHGSGALRSTLPSLLDGCELLMKIGDEYRIQTEESAAWNDEFLSQQSALSNEAHRIENERDDRIRKKFGETARTLSLTQGNAKVARDIYPVFDAQLPPDANQRICVWVRDGWSTDENSVRADARQAGNQSPTVFVFIPKRSADDLRHHLIDYKASSATLDKRGVPNTPEGAEARAAMETTRQTAESRICELLEEAFSGSRVFQGGGNEILGSDLREMVLEAANNALQRLFPNFHAADHAGWAKVYEQAKKGAPDALKAIGYDGEVEKNPVCKAVLSFIAGGKKGTDIRARFESAPYGWPRDAVDGALQCLLLAGHIRAQDEHGSNIVPNELERKAISKVIFKAESASVNAVQRIQIRKLLQKAGLSAKQGEEVNYVPQFLQVMADFAGQAGGEAPKPSPPDTASLEKIRLTSGNEQLLALYDRREELGACLEDWKNTAQRIAERLPAWNDLQRLASHASGLQEAGTLLAQIQTVEQKRQLLAEPDPVAPLLSGLVQILREELNRLDGEYAARHKAGMSRLDDDRNWQQLKPEQRYQLMSKQNLREADQPKVSVQTTQDVLKTLDTCDLANFKARVAALSARFDEVLKGAAALCEPQVQFVHVPIRTLQNEEELEAWLDEVRQKLKAHLKNGPVRFQEK